MYNEVSHARLMRNIIAVSTCIFAITLAITSVGLANTQSQIVKLLTDQNNLIRHTQQILSTTTIQPATQPVIQH